ncbi:MAG TPA: HD domain-containing protein [Syntrophorhabdales bacterium]|nr:HD domain-containing protein [Syntrophorhabdales bacterium]
MEFGICILQALANKERRGYYLGVNVSLELLRERIKNLDVIAKLSVPHFAGRIYLVGGAIRELALGQSPVDYDFALERAEDTARLEELFRTKGFFLGKKPAQTYRVVGADGVFDLTFIHGDILSDLARRDFTMNAIGYDTASGDMFDPYGGLGDISRRLIRYPRRESLKEDPLRMLKAVRHLATLPDFSLDHDLVQAIHEERDLIRLTAPERVKYELDLIMLSPDPYKGIAALRDTRLLFLLFPELSELEQMDREKGFDLETLGHTIEGFKYLDKAKAFHPFDEQDTRSTAYALLFHDLGKAYTFSYDETKQRVHFFYHEKHSREMAAAIMERLRFSSHEIRVISTLIEQHMRVFLISHEGATDKAVRRLVYKMGDLTPPLVLLTLLDMYGSSNGEENETTVRVRERCTEALSAYDDWRRAPLPGLVNGYDLLALGFPEGPRVGKVLDVIREKQVSGEITDKSAALEYARQQLETVNTGKD